MRTRKLLGAIPLLLACAATKPAPRSVSDCPSLDLSAVGSLDLAIVIDASRSTNDPSGSDINQNGRVGEAKLGRVGLLFDIGSTDPGDSYLAAQVSATRSLIRAVVGPDRRLAVIAFCGMPLASRRPAECESSATVISELTGDINNIDAGLDRVLLVGSNGSTDFAAGMNAALQVFPDASPSNSSATRRLVLFISESPLPVLPGEKGVIRQHDPAMKDAALRAVDAEIVFNTFGLGEAAQSVPPFALSQIATATGGAYRSVSDPATLHCELARSLTP